MPKVFRPDKSPAGLAALAALLREALPLAAECLRKGGVNPLGQSAFWAAVRKLEWHIDVFRYDEDRLDDAIQLADAFGEFVDELSNEARGFDAA